jgi:hypothetical protein
MTPDEFYKTAIIKEDRLRKTVDVRPFGDRQGEAFDFYLADLFAKIKDPTYTMGKPIVVLRGPGQFVPPPTAMDCVEKLKVVGVAIRVEEGNTSVPDSGVLTEGHPSVPQSTKPSVSPSGVGHWNHPDKE